MKRHVPLMVMAFIMLLLIGGLHCWNNHVPAVPTSLAGLVPGKSTVRDFVVAVGVPCQRWRTCTGSGLYFSLGRDSSGYGRVLCVEADYHRTFRQKNVPKGGVAAEDDDEVITRISIGTTTKFDRYTGNFCSRTLATLSDIDYDLFHPHRE